MLPFMVTKDPEEGSQCSQTIMLSTVPQHFPNLTLFAEGENVLQAPGLIYLQGRQNLRNVY